MTTKFYRCLQIAVSLFVSNTLFYAHENEPKEETSNNQQEQLEYTIEEKTTKENKDAYNEITQEEDDDVELPEEAFPTCLQEAELLFRKHNTSTQATPLITHEEFRSLATEALKDEFYKRNMTEEERQSFTKKNPKKNALVLNYMAADNNLHYFAWKNIQQSERIGSNEHVNIVTQLNVPGIAPTKRYLIQKGRRTLAPAEGYQAHQKLNSGDPQTLIDFVLWAYEHYPADHVYLIIWNHGLGPIDPAYVRSLNTCDLFYANQETNMLEINRRGNYLDFATKDIYEDLPSKRGICFDETYKSYISNSDLARALDVITQAIGKKIDVVGFDACLMAAIEVTNACKRSAQYMVGSQEVEFGVGWNYEEVLSIFTKKKAPTPEQFAKKIVSAFDQYYKYVTPDYTLSAIDLEKTELIEQQVHAISHLLIHGLSMQEGNSVKKILEESKSPKWCTCFEEPTFIDLHHFLENIYNRTNKIRLTDPSETANFIHLLKTNIETCLQAIRNAVIANATGENLKKAQGISIYFPELGIARLYPKSPFASENSWITLLFKYMYSR